MSDPNIHVVTTTLKGGRGPGDSPPSNAALAI